MGGALILYPMFFQPAFFLPSPCHPIIPSANGQCPVGEHQMVQSDLGVVCFPRIPAPPPGDAEHELTSAQNLAARQQLPLQFRPLLFPLDALTNGPFEVAPFTGTLPHPGMAKQCEEGATNAMKHLGKGN